MKRKMPRPLSLVKFDFRGVPKKFHKNYRLSPERTYVFLGEIANMPGHCVVADQIKGRIYSGYHTENFTELSEDEI